MISSSKFSRILVLLVAFLALSPCWASPAPSHNHDLVLAHAKDSEGKGKGKRSRPTTPDNKPGGGGESPPNAPGRENTASHFPLTKALTKWLESKKEILPYVIDSVGGIEIWVQVDFEAFVKKGFGGQQFPTILREQPVYQKTKGLPRKTKRADWVFVPKPGDVDNLQGIIVELKVQSSSNTKKSFQTLVEKDVQKLQLDLKPDYKKFDRAVVAIAWNPEFDKGMLASGLSPVHSVKLADKAKTLVTIYANEKERKVSAEDNDPPPPFGPSGSGQGGRGGGSGVDLPTRPKPPPKDLKGKGPK
jgi:hypothetical protein